jgi:perosamine synthetase
MVTPASVSVSPHLFHALGGVVLQSVANAPTPIRIPLAIPNLDEAEERAVLACLRSGWISAISPVVQQFEEAFAFWLDQSSSVYSLEALATNSGTTALLLALRVGLEAQGITDFSQVEVLVPALTFVATVNPVRYLGAIPVFVDADPVSLAMAIEDLAAALTPRTKAIIVTHLFGLPANMSALVAFARQHGLLLIEDASEALGTHISDNEKTAYAGCWGDFGCFSFNGNKTITTGGGGMVVSGNKAFMARVRHLALQARTQPLSKQPYPQIEHDGVGYNARMTGLAAAMGLAQLAKLNVFLQAKQRFAKTYAQHLQAITGANTGLLQAPSNQGSSWWLSPLLLATPSLRHGLITHALSQGIECRPFFKPINTLPPYQHHTTRACPVATNLWQHGVCLPSSSQMTPSQQAEVIGAILAFLKTGATVD